MKRLKILVPLDFSDMSRGALAQALGWAASAPLEVHVVHVVDDLGDGRATSEPSILAHWLLELERTATAVLVDVIPDVQAREELGELQHHLIAGDPATEITRLAAHLGMRLIVMGTHGRGGSRELAAGSVAQAVLRHSPCPTVLVGPVCFAGAPQAPEARATAMTPTPRRKASMARMRFAGGPAASIVGRRSVAPR